MNWTIGFTSLAQKDLRKLDPTVRREVYKAIEKVLQNPTSDGYGKPLGNKGGNDLSGCMKIKLKHAGIRVIYKLEETDGIMNVIIIGARADNEVYKEAARRLKKTAQEEKLQSDM